MKTEFVGATTNGLAIASFTFGSVGPRALILGGVHGDEPEGVEVALGLIERWRHGFRFGVTATVVPALNLDGVLRHQRVNANGVDLNRNLGTRDWSPIAHDPRYTPGPRPESESESRALVRLIGTSRPALIVSLHSFRPQINVNGACAGPARAMAAVNGYPITDSIGYPTPGCLGTWAGVERGVPTITYEVERGLAAPEVVRLHPPAVEAALEYLAEGPRDGR